MSYSCSSLHEHRFNADDGRQQTNRLELSIRWRCIEAKTFSRRPARVWDHQDRDACFRYFSRYDHLSNGFCIQTIYAKPVNNNIFSSMMVVKIQIAFNTDLTLKMLYSACQSKVWYYLDRDSYLGHLSTNNILPSAKYMSIVPNSSHCPIVSTSYIKI